MRLYLWMLLLLLGCGTDEERGGQGGVRVPATAGEAVRRHWRLYVYEGVELGWFMVAACVARWCCLGWGRWGCGWCRMLRCGGW